MYCNHSINFYIYCCTGNYFTKHLFFEDLLADGQGKNEKAMSSLQLRSLIQLDHMIALRQRIVM